MLVAAVGGIHGEDRYTAACVAGSVSALSASKYLAGVYSSDAASWENVTCIPANAFASRKGGVDLSDLESRLLSIDDGAFRGFSGSLTMDGDFSKLTFIGEEAFCADCGGTRGATDMGGWKVNFADLLSLVTIEKFAFNDFGGNLSITVSSPFLAYVGEKAFNEAGNPKSSTVEILEPGLLKHVGKQAFYALKAKLTLAGETPYLSSIPQYAFAGDGKSVTSHMQESRLNFTDLPLLEIVESGAFMRFPGVLKFESKCPKLTELGSYTFRSTQGSIKIKCRAESGLEVKSSPFSSFNGRTGYVPPWYYLENYPCPVETPNLTPCDGSSENTALRCKGRYLWIDRLAVWTQSGDATINLAEVQGYAYNKYLPGGTLQKATKAELSSTYASTTTADKCIDGRAADPKSCGSYCFNRCQSNDDDPWLRIDYGRAKDFFKIVVTNKTPMINILGARVALTADADGKDVVWESWFRGCGVECTSGGSSTSQASFTFDVVVRSEVEETTATTTRSTTTTGTSTTTSVTSSSSTTTFSSTTTMSSTTATTTVSTASTTETTATTTRSTTKTGTSATTSVTSSSSTATFSSTTTTPMAATTLPGNSGADSTHDHAAAATSTVDRGTATQTSSPIVAITELAGAPKLSTVVPQNRTPEGEGSTGQQGNQSFNSTVDNSSADESLSGKDGAVIAGSVIGAFLGAGVIAVAGLFLYKLWQRRRSNQSVKTILSANTPNPSFQSTPVDMPYASSHLDSSA